jgi:hypothetical protein
VLGGAIAIVSGLIALYTVKGSRLHRRSGTVFVGAMLVMALSGATIAVGRAGAEVNIPAGLVTAYLVTTALLTVRAPSVRSRRIERGAMVAAFVLGVASLMSAFVTVGQGRPVFAFPLVMFGLVALSGGVGDRRMLRAGGLQGTARLKRHLWRMCAALSIAAASFFLGPVSRIPEPLRTPPFRLIPLAVLLTMAYWLWRYRRKGTRGHRDDVSEGINVGRPSPTGRETGGRRHQSQTESMSSTHDVCWLHDPDDACRIRFAAFRRRETKRASAMARPDGQARRENRPSVSARRPGAQATTHAANCTK